MACCTVAWCCEGVGTLHEGSGKPDAELHAAHWLRSPDTARMRNASPKSKVQDGFWPVPASQKNTGNGVLGWLHWLAPASVEPSQEGTQSAPMAMLPTQTPAAEAGRRSRLSAVRGERPLND